jgi:nitrite reductase/ring-hydroxylating ferredoxin subunit
VNTWTDAFSADQLPPGSARAFRRGGDQVAVFHAPDGALYAVANRCPHEGYPLVQGQVLDGSLTCAWHNFKFDLRSGACLVGDDPVRVYPVRQQDGRIKLDLTPPDPAVTIAERRADLEDALVDGRIGQAVRELVRLQQLGLSGAELATLLCTIDARYARYGTSHGSAAVLVGLRRAGGRQGKELLAHLLPGLRMIGEAIRRLPLRPRAEPCAGLSDRDGRAFLAAVEGERLGEAEGLLRGALAAGWNDEVIAWLGAAAASHMLSFAHPLIYLTHLTEHLRSTAFEGADVVLGGLVAAIVYGTRTDTLPPWSSWSARVTASGLDLKTLAAMPRSATADPKELAALLLDPDEAAAFAAIADGLCRGVALDHLADALVLAAADTLLRFDCSLDPDPTIQDDWLNVTHALTAAIALRIRIEQGCAAGETVRQLLLVTRFVHGMVPLLRAEAERPRIEGSVAEHGAGLIEACLHDPSSRPIIVVHLLKTTAAAIEVAPLLSADPSRPLAAAQRLWNQPPRTFNSDRLLHDAWVNVVDGKIPRTRMR